MTGDPRNLGELRDAGHAHIEILDGVRGLAILLVLLRHYIPPLFGGAGIVGVDMFFVLSGFLISTLLLQEFRAAGWISMGGFYLRRALRLLPALYFFLAVYVVAWIVLPLPSDGTDVISGVVLAAFYVFNWAPALGITVPDDMGPLWTLSVEEQFYLVWPLILIVALRSGVRPRLIAAGVGVVIVGASVFRVALWDGVGDELYTLTPTWIDALLGGVLLAIARAEGLQLRFLLRAPVQLAAWAVVTGCLFVPEMKSHEITYLLLLPLLALSLTTVVWGCIAEPRRPIHDALRRPGFLWLGAISYSLYLWNYAVRTILLELGAGPAVALVGLPISFAFALASVRLVERPALALKSRLPAARPAHRRPRRAADCPA